MRLFAKGRIIRLYRRAVPSLLSSKTRSAMGKAGMPPLFAMAFAAMASVAPDSGWAAPAGGRLEQVRHRGAVVCGVAPSLAGFSIPDRQGRWTGLDVDPASMRQALVEIFGR